MAGKRRRIENVNAGDYVSPIKSLTMVPKFLRCDSESGYPFPVSKNDGLIHLRRFRYAL